MHNMYIKYILYIPARKTNSEYRLKPPIALTPLEALVTNFYVVKRTIK